MENEWFSDSQYLSTLVYDLKELLISCKQNVTDNEY